MPSILYSSKNMHAENGGLNGGYKFQSNKLEIHFFQIQFYWTKVPQRVPNYSTYSICWMINESHNYLWFKSKHQCFLITSMFFTWHRAQNIATKIDQAKALNWLSSWNDRELLSIGIPILTFSFHWWPWSMDMTSLQFS